MNQFIEWLTGVFKGVRCWFIVLPWEQSVRIRMGKAVTLFGPGWHLRIPLLDDVRTFNNRLRLTSFPSLTVMSKDGKTITASGLIGFRIANPLKAMLALQQPEATCGGLAMGQIARYISERTYAEASYEGAAASAVAALQGQAPGIAIEFVRLVDFASVKTFRLLQDQWRPGTTTDAAL